VICELLACASDAVVPALEAESIAVAAAVATGCAACEDSWRPKRNLRVAVDIQQQAASNPTRRPLVGHQVIDISVVVVGKLGTDECEFHLTSKYLEKDLSLAVRTMNATGVNRLAFFRVEIVVSRFDLKLW
jgi:hypothetical protein